MKRLMGCGIVFVFFLLYHAPTASAIAVIEPGSGSDSKAFCPTVTTVAPWVSGTYSCDLTLRDRLSRPQAGKTVTLTMKWCNSSGISTIATATGITDATGHAFVTTAAARAANTATCWVNAPRTS